MFISVLPLNHCNERCNILQLLHYISVTVEKNLIRLKTPCRMLHLSLYCCALVLTLATLIMDKLVYRISIPEYRTHRSCPYTLVFSWANRDYDIVPTWLLTNAFQCSGCWFKASSRRNSGRGSQGFFMCECICCLGPKWPNALTEVSGVTIHPERGFASCHALLQQYLEGEA